MLSLKDKFGSAGFDWDLEKSGFTPLGLHFPGMQPNVNDDEFKHRQTIEEFQRSKLLGHTVTECIQMDVFPAREMKPATLSNGIIKLLQLPRWEKIPPKEFSQKYMYAIGNGKVQWTLHNLVVLDVMKPVLRLASRMLQSADLLPWLHRGSVAQGTYSEDTLKGSRYMDLHQGQPRECPRVDSLSSRTTLILCLCSGDRRNIEGWRKPANLAGTDMWNLQSFHRRPAHKMQNVEKDRDSLFEELMTTYDCLFGFAKSDENPKDGDPQEERYGSTFYLKRDTRTPRFFVMLSFEMAGPLLAEINSAERMCTEWLVAQTLVHETMHLCYLKWAWKTSPIEEIYFEDEQAMEIGYSHENACYGGLIHPLAMGSDFPLGFHLETPWPVENSLELCVPTDPVLKPALDTDTDIYHISLTLVEDAYQDDFWELNSRQYGHKLTRLRYISLPSDGLAHSECHYEIPFEDERNYLKHAIHGRNIKDRCSMTPDEIRQLKFANDIFESAQREWKFWLGTLGQNFGMEEFQEMANGANIGSSLRLEMLDKVIEAVKRHHRTVMVLNDIEKYDAHASTARRKNLLDWNRGTRIFLNGFPHNAFDLEKTRLDLEESRMSLWCPKQPDPDSATPTTERIEFDLLQSLQALLSTRQHEGVAEICDQILQALSVTFFGRTCVEIALEALKTPSSKVLKIERAQYINKRMRTLKRLGNFGMRGIDTGWKNVVDEWLKICLDMQNRAGLLCPVDDAGN